MGAGIAQLLIETLISGHVTLVERDRAAAASAVARVEAGLRRRFRSDDELDAKVAENMTRFHAVAGLDEAKRADLVIEAVPENLELKLEVLCSLPQSPGTLVATNTSSLSVSQLAAGLAPGMPFVGMHFFNPVPTSALIELVLPDGCTGHTVGLAQQWVARLGREAIVVQDSPGFATSRLGVLLGMEAIRMLEEGVSTAIDIDRGMVLGYKYPIGPLELTDRVGLDVRLAISDHLFETLGERFRVPQLLRDKVAAGELGQKVGRGFYTWHGHSDPHSGPH